MKSRERNDDELRFCRDPAIRGEAPVSARTEEERIVFWTKCEIVRHRFLAYHFSYARIHTGRITRFLHRQASHARTALLLITMKH